ncbi:hypothetical protein C8R48DRAFT_688934 [Suillus tomentosus]|nr:hypothetical protein C8R48DRAFT_688934 [Suillus tomentosus]
MSPATLEDEKLLLRTLDRKILSLTCSLYLLACIRDLSHELLEKQMSLTQASDLDLPVLAMLDWWV